MTEEGAAPAEVAEQPASYTTQEAGRLLAISVQTVQRWMDLGHLSGWRTPGGHRRIDPASVDRLLRMATLDSVPQQKGPSEARVTLNIMLVDDSEDDLEILEAVVRAVLAEASVIKVKSGFAALMHIGRNQPDLLLTDISMHGFDGLQMIQALTEDTRTASLPVIAVSNYFPEEIVRRFGKLPTGLLMLKKPVSPNSLRNALALAAPHIASTISVRA